MDISDNDQPQFTLPSRLRLLCVGAVEPSWVSLTLQLDAQQCVDPQFRWVSTANKALSRLRNETFDCIIICFCQSATEHQSNHDAFELVRAIRASGCDSPLILMTPRVTDQEWTDICAEECEVFVTQTLWESLALVPFVKRTILRAELSRENHRMGIANQRRVQRERGEADDLLKQQRQIIEELRTMSRVEIDDAAIEFPAAIGDFYQELLRTYVIMGSGNLGSEIAKLGELLGEAQISPRHALELHVERVENLVGGLGNRSTRHVMARADLLVLELIIHLGECYQRKWLATGEARTSLC